MRHMTLRGNEVLDGSDRYGCTCNNRLAGQVRSGGVGQWVGVLKLVATLSTAIIGSCIAPNAVHFDSDSLLASYGSSRPLTVLARRA